MYNLNFAAFNSPVYKEDIQVYKDYAKSLGVGDGSKTIKFLSGFFIFMFIVMPSFAQLTEGAAFGALMHLAITSAAYYLVNKYLIKTLVNKMIERKARLYKFARDNNLQYLPGTRVEQQDGAIFNIGRSRSISDSLVFPDGTQIANYNYTTGSGKRSQTHYWGYIRLQLKRNVPHMLLDSKKNNFFGGSNLPTSFSKSLRLSLEGDFNNYFTLYAPEEYRTDALYVFTPDVMQAVIDADEKHGYDMETIDNHFYIYRHGRFDLNKLEDWNTIESVMNIIHPRINKQTERYSDANVADRSLGLVAEPGRRLERKTSVGVILFVALIFIFVFYMMGSILSVMTS